MIQKWIKLHRIIKSKPGKATQNLIPVRLEKVKVKMLLKKELDRRISYAVQRCYKELEFGQLMEASVCGRGSVFSRPNGWEWHPHRDIHYCAGQHELRFNTQQQTSNALTRAWDLKSSLNTDAYIRDNFHKDQKLPVFGMCYMFYRRNMHLQSSHPHIHSNTFNQGVTVQLFHFLSASLQPKQSSQRNRFTSHSFSCRSYLSVGQLSWRE